MVTTLSREMTLSYSSPFADPTGTSLLSPLAVDVIGATVTFVMAARAAARVRTTTGRVLSRRARQISRTLVGDVDVACGPGHQGVQFIVSPLLAQDRGVVFGGLAAHLPFQGDANQGSTAGGLALGHGLVQEGHHLLG